MPTIVDGNSGGTVITNSTYTPGMVIQVVNYLTGAVATGTGAIPFDDTIPQNTEGSEYMTLAITPKSATSQLKIEVIFYGGNGTANNWTVVAMFQDSGVNAIASGYGYVPNINASIPTVFTHYMVSGTTSSTTFKVRAGINGGGTLTFNGAGAARRMGGVLSSSITITEIAQ
jgi:hypothetical protein